MKEQYLRSIHINREKIKNETIYPFDLPVVKHLEVLDLHPQVTFLVGENGVGKSTLIEAIALAYGFNPEGGSKNFNFKTRETHSALGDYLTLVKGIKYPKDGYFLRAESYYNTATNIDELDELPSYGPPIIDSYGGVSLHKQSHGESFWSLFTHRLSGQGVYIFDEPEAALSPQRQIAFLKRLNDLVNKGGQFIIATHSPIIMAYPQAQIIELDESGYHLRDYEETQHYKTYKRFLKDRESVLRAVEIS